MKEPTRTNREIDSALTLVGGNFSAAAKLLDMEPRAFQNRLHYDKFLRAKWGKRPGRPKGRLGFSISPFNQRDLLRQNRSRFLDRMIVVLVRNLDRQQVVDVLTRMYEQRRRELPAGLATSGALGSPTLASPTSLPRPAALSSPASV